MARGATAANFSLQVSEFMDAEDLRAWFVKAKPGDEVVYAVTPTLLNHPTGQLARSLYDRGLLKLCQRRSADRRYCFEYIATKCLRVPDAVHAKDQAANDQARGRKVTGEPPRDDAWRASREGRVYSLLFRDVADGRVCPSNGEIAERLDLDHRYAAKYALARLREAGLIRFEQTGRHRVRIVTIIATGKSSADPEEVAHG